MVWGPCRHLVWGPRSLCVVLGARRRAWMVLLGAHRFSWVEVLGARRIVHGWWWCALVLPFLGGGGGGAPLWVFVRRVVLSPFEGEGGGWSFMFAGAPSVVIVIGVILHRFCVLSSRVVLIACPRCCCVSSPCRCLMPSLLLSLLCPRCDVSFGCTTWHLC